MHRAMLLIVTAVAVGLAAWSPSSLYADSHQIQVLSQSAVSDFPDGVRFYIEALSPDEIDDIRVFFKKIGQTSRSSYRAVEFPPGKWIRGESLIRSGGGGEYIPPGTRIGYSFEIRDKGGRTLRTDEEVLVYLDNRFPWQTKTRELVTVFYDDPREEAVAQLVLDAAIESKALMGPILGVEPTYPLHIVAYSDYRYMNEALPFRSAAVERHLITQGMAFGNERVLLVYGGDANVEGTTRHEFAHLLVDDAVGGLLSTVPLWLNEGLAEYSSAAARTDTEEILAYRLPEDQIRPLWHLQSFSGKPGEIIDAYQQSLSVVAYLISAHGEEKVAETLRALRSTLDIDKALQQVYGFDQHGLDTQWRASRGLEAIPPPQKARPRLQQRPQAIAGLELPTSSADSRAPSGESPTTTASPVAPSTGPSDGLADSVPTGTGSSCGVGAYAGNAPADLTLILLLGSVLALVSASAWRRRGGW